MITEDFKNKWFDLFLQTLMWFDTDISLDELNEISDFIASDQFTYNSEPLNEVLKFLGLNESSQEILDRYNEIRQTFIQ